MTIQVQKEVKESSFKPERALSQENTNEIRQPEKRFGTSLMKNKYEKVMRPSNFNVKNITGIVSNRNFSCFSQRRKDEKKATASRFKQVSYKCLKFENNLKRKKTS